MFRKTGIESEFGGGGEVPEEFAGTNVPGVYELRLRHPGNDATIVVYCGKGTAIPGGVLARLKSHANQAARDQGYKLQKYIGRAVDYSDSAAGGACLDGWYLEARWSVGNRMTAPLAAMVEALLLGRIDYISNVTDNDARRPHHIVGASGWEAANQLENAMWDQVHAFTGDVKALRKDVDTEISEWKSWNDPSSSESSVSSSYASVSSDSSTFDFSNLTSSVAEITSRIDDLHFSVKNAWTGVFKDLQQSSDVARDMGILGESLFANLKDILDTSVGLLDYAKAEMSLVLDALAHLRDRDLPGSFGDAKVDLRSAKDYFSGLAGDLKNMVEGL